MKSAFDAAPGQDIITGRTVDAQGADSVSTPLPQNRTIDRSVVLAAGNSASLFVRRSVFDRIGAFDERFGLGAETEFESSEELDFLVRALQARLGIAYTRDLTVFHDQVHPGDYEAQVRRTATYARGFGAMLRKNRFGAAFLMLLTARTLGGIAVRAVQRRPLLAKQKITQSRNVVSGYLKWVE